MPPHVIDELWGEIARVGGPGTRVIFRTAGEKSPIEGALTPEHMARFECDQKRARELHLQDRSAIYGMFHIYQLRDAAGAN
jgi:S-adenosylmethionine-diacylglycerol 3-amino-3-carboxypropyl transferase